MPARFESEVRGLLRQELQHRTVVVVGNEDVGAITYDSRWPIPGSDGVDDNVLSGIDDRDCVVELVVDVNFVPVVCDAPRAVSDGDGIDDGVGVWINDGHRFIVPVGDVDIVPAVCDAPRAVSDGDGIGDGVGVGVDHGNSAVGDKVGDVDAGAVVRHS